MREKVWSDELILARLRQIAERDGQPPTQRQLNDDPSLPSSRTICKRFGGFNEALRRAGLPTRPKGSGKKPPRNQNELMLDSLRRFHKEFGRVPLEPDHTACEYLSARSTFRRRFGTFNAAVKAAGLEPRRSTGSHPGRKMKNVPEMDRTQFQGWTFDKEKGKPAPINERRFKRNAVQRVSQE